MVRSVLDTSDDENFETVIGVDGRPVRIVRDGRVLRTSMFAKDSMMTPVQRAVRDDAERHRIVDAFGGSSGLNRPGFRFSSNVFSRDAAIVEYARYEDEISNAWRSPQTGAGEEEDEEEVDRVVAETERHYGSNPIPRKRPPRTDSLPVDQMVRDHRQNMARLYDQYNHDVANAWRNPS